MTVLRRGPCGRRPGGSRAGLARRERGARGPTVDEIEIWKLEESRRAGARREAWKKPRPAEYRLGSSDPDVTENVYRPHAGAPSAWSRNAINAYWTLPSLSLGGEAT
jgi:hypothetical protein